MTQIFYSTVSHLNKRKSTLEYIFTELNVHMLKFTNRRLRKKIITDKKIDVDPKFAEISFEIILTLLLLIKIARSALTET